MNSDYLTMEGFYKQILKSRALKLYKNLLFGFYRN